MDNFVLVDMIVAGKDGSFFSLWYAVVDGKVVRADIACPPLMWPEQVYPSGKEH